MNHLIVTPKPIGRKSFVRTHHLSIPFSRLELARLIVALLSKVDFGEGAAPPQNKWNWFRVSRDAHQWGSRPRTRPLARFFPQSAGKRRSVLLLSTIFTFTQRFVFKRALTLSEQTMIQSQSRKAQICDQETSDQRIQILNRHPARLVSNWFRFGILEINHIFLICQEWAVSRLIWLARNHINLL